MYEEKYSNHPFYKLKLTVLAVLRLATDTANAFSKNLKWKIYFKNGKNKLAILRSLDAHGTPWGSAINLGGGDWYISENLISPSKSLSIT